MPPKSRLSGLPARTLILPVALFISMAPVLGWSKSESRAAGPIIVSTTNDESTSGDGLCSLREAISNANARADTTGGDCAAGTGMDTIEFKMSGTITLVGKGLPPIENTLIIDGRGHTITVDGAKRFRVFVVSPGAALGLNDLTVANGRSDFGGGIFNEAATNDPGVAAGTLTLTNCTLVGNTASAGGGIANEGTLTITDTTFSANLASNAGGAILNPSGSGWQGMATVTDSTFSANTASVAGGAIWSSGKLLVTNSNFSGNSSGGLTGGAIFNSGTLSVTNSTLSRNSGGAGICSSAFPDGHATISNSILAANAGGNCCSHGGNSNITNGGDNVSDDASCGFGADVGANGRTIATELVRSPTSSD